MVRERNEAAREKEFVRQDMLASVARDQMILSNASSDERVMTMRRNRIMAAEQQERQIVESVHRETSRRRAVQQRAATEQAVATELQKLRDMSRKDAAAALRHRARNPGAAGKAGRGVREAGGAVANHRERSAACRHAPAQGGDGQDAELATEAMGGG